MKAPAVCLSLALSVFASVLPAQMASASSASSASSGSSSGSAGAVLSPKAARNKKHATVAPAPFSRLALSGGMSIMGINMQAATNIDRHFNVRATGNYFGYTVNNIKISGNGGSNGVNVTGKLNFATMGASLDYYPFPKLGFRLSPGVMLYNQNGISANGVAATGTSFTLDSQKYYSEAANPLNVNAKLGLNTHQQAFTMTTGWGNLISRKGGHLSFPVEIGAVFTGVPSIGLNLTGFGCTAQADAAANGDSCVNMATNTAAQTNLNSQIAKYQKDLNPLQVFPILSFGIGYNFSIGKRHAAM